jgi:hypothetical protein
VFDGSVPPSGQLGGDELAAFPYAYTIGPRGAPAG